jgi:maltooligosyltrehalose trehalohydrolase
VHAIHDESALHLLEEIAERVDALGAEVGRPLTLIAESDLNDPRVVRERSAGGLGMTAQWSDDFHHALHSVLTGETSGYYADYGSLGQLAKALRQAFVYDGCYSALRDRRFGRKPDGLPRTRFLGYLQNHDQIGNRATGERSAHLLSEGRLRVAAALVLLSPFVPMLFQGEEWGATTPFQYFTSHEDEQLAESVRVGRRREFAAFGWRPEDVPDPQDPATFERSKLDWSQPAEPPHAGLLEWHRRLIALRRDLATDGSWPKVGYDEQARWLTVSRLGVTVAANLGDQPVDIPVDGSEIALASDDAVHLADRLLALPPSSVAAVR